MLPKYVVSFIFWSWFYFVLGFDVVLNFCLFFKKALKVGWVEEGEDLEELGEGEDDKIYFNLKIVLKNEKYNKSGV